MANMDIAKLPQSDQRQMLMRNLFGQMHLGYRRGVGLVAVFVFFVLSC